MQTKASGTLISLGVASAVILIDQLTKALALKYLVAFQPNPVLGDLLHFTLVFNDRAAFSLGGSATWLFTITSTIASLALLYIVPRFKTKGWLVLGGFALGGVVGNLIDRIIREPGFPNGHVIDFIQLPLGFPVFNIADMAISITAVIIAIKVMLGQKVGGGK